MTVDQPFGPDDHPDELLSAHVDGELDAATEARVEDHLAGCAPCRRSVAELSEAQSLLRGLPPVDASPVIEGFLARHRRTIRLGAGFVAVAGLVLLALGFTGATQHPSVAPDVAALAANHVREAHAEMGEREPDAGAAYVAPPGLMGSAVSLSRHETWDGSDMSAVVYRSGDIDLSVYQQPGRLDWDGLPPGDIVPMGDRDVWIGPGQPVVAVTQRGDLVLTVVSADRAAVLTAVAGMPEWQRRSRWDRVHDACQRLVRVFALDG